jgi:hypothetical protein
MKRFAIVFVAVVLSSIAFASPAWAGAPHFVDDKVSFSADGATLTASFKEAGLGNETQIHVVLTADAACINPGDNHPQAANKESFNAAGDFPVQNGKAEGSLSLTAVFSPSCSPPMTVVFSNVVLTDTTNGISVTL